MVVPTAVHKWLLNEGSGTTAADTGSASAIDLTVSSGNWVTDAGSPYGKAYNPSSESDDTSVSWGTMTGGDGTVTFWVRRTGDWSSGRMVANTISGNGSGCFGPATTDNMEVRTYNGGWHSVVATSNHPLDEWHFYAGSWSSAGLEIWYDGTSEAGPSGNGGMNATSMKIFGSDNYTNNSYMADIRIFSTVLTDAEVVEVMDDVITDVTVEPTALSMSTTAEEPNIISQVPGGAVSMAISVLQPTLDIPIHVPVSALGMSINVLGITFPGSIGVHTEKGTVGTTPLDKNYPYIEGLIAGTTKQTNNPNLVEQKW